MHRIRNAALALLLALVALPAFAAPPSADQIDRLLEVTDARKMIDDMLPVLMQQSTQMATSALPADATDADRRKLQDIMQAQQRGLADAMRWDRLRPMYVRIYGEEFSAEEVQAMIGFYESPEGRSAMAKMPQVLQRTMVEMQPMILEMVANMEREVKAAMASPGAE